MQLNLEIANVVDIVLQFEVISEALWDRIPAACRVVDSDKWVKNDTR